MNIQNITKIADVKEELQRQSERRCEITKPVAFFSYFEIKYCSFLKWSKALHINLLCSYLYFFNKYRSAIHKYERLGCVILARNLQSFLPSFPTRTKLFL